MNKLVILVALIPLLMLAPTLSYASTVPRACDENKSCVITYPNGTQSVFLSNHKLLCIKTGIMIAVDKLIPGEGDDLISAAGNVTASCLTGGAK